MGFIPPKTPPKPNWMSIEDYRKILKQENHLLTRIERRSGIIGFFRSWFIEWLG